MNPNYKKIVGVLIAAWFAVTVSASAFQLFRNDSAIPSIPFLLAVVTPILLFVLWYFSSSGFRQFVLSLNPRVLTLLHSWRIVGFIFVTLYFLGVLPGIFALPAGLGDMAVGVTAPWAARKLATPARRGGFIFWQSLGITDLVLALTLGATARLISPEGPSMVPMTVLPLSLIPTFLVPLLLILHIISIAQATRWPQRQYTNVGEALRTSAS